MSTNSLGKLNAGLGELTLVNCNEMDGVKKKKGQKPGPRPLFESMIQPQWDAVVKPFQNNSNHVFSSVDKSLLFVMPNVAKEDCPICFLVLPELHRCQYQACCGVILCLGCMKGVIDDQDEKNKANGSKLTDKLPLCPFCRESVGISIEENVSRVESRVDANPGDHHALSILGLWYLTGQGDILAQNVKRGMEMLLSAAELGSADAYFSLGNAYNPLLDVYPGVEKNLMTSVHYYEWGAIAGHVQSRYNLGVLNMKFFFDHSITMKHFHIAASQGSDEALKVVKIGYMIGDVTKDEFESSLRANHESKTSVKSNQRMEADLRRVETGEFTMGEQLDNVVQCMGGWCFLSM
ncbi:hypothetical protein N9140_00340 [bacterium]|nr:hypothetical protein [bacterium]